MAKGVDPEAIVAQHQKLLELMASECKRHWLQFFFYGYIRHWDSIEWATEKHYKLQADIRTYDALVIKDRINEYLSPQ